MARQVLLILVILFLCYRSYVYATTWTPFTPHQTSGMRLLHKYKTQQVMTTLHCLIECSLDSRCLASNYLWTTRTCELNDMNVYAVNGYDSENVENWRIYTKGIPSCNGGWMSHEQSCYYFSTEMTSWADAVDACRTKNAVLVQIEGENEDNFIVDRLKLLHEETVGKAYWTNGNDIDIQNQYVWGYPGGQAIGEYTNWNIGDPNGGSNEDCIALYGSIDFKWVDVTCSALFYYICEKQPSV